MEITLAHPNFHIDTKSSHKELGNYLESFLFDAFSKKYSKILFTWTDIYKVNSVNNGIFLKKFYFNPSNGNTYILELGDINYFENKYFPNHKFLNRNPDLYTFYFNRPLLKENFHTSDSVNFFIEEDKYKLDTNELNFDFIKSEPSKKIFFRDTKFLFYNLKKFIETVSNFDLKKINIGKFIFPIFKLSDEEIEFILEYEEKGYRELEKEDENKKQKELERGWDIYDNSVSDEFYRETFNNDSSNEWNID